MSISKCLNCNHIQVIDDKNIWQDIKGKFTVCEKCNEAYALPEEER